MKKLKKVIIQVCETDGSISEVEIPPSFLDLYRKETGHKRVVAKFLAKFIDNLVKLHTN